MGYNFEYIDIKCSLINAFLIEASENIVDISYSVNLKTILIQVVLLEGSILEDEIQSRVKNNLSTYEVIINKLFITKDKFNENIGNWQPIYYNWLDNLLFSKAEI